MTRAEQWSPITRRAELQVKHGPTFAMPHDLVDDDGSPLVIVYGVLSEDAAKAYAEAEAELGNEARAEVREGAGWVVVCDLRPQIAEHEKGRVAPQVHTPEP